MDVHRERITTRHPEWDLSYLEKVLPEDEPSTKENDAAKAGTSRAAEPPFQASTELGVAFASFSTDPQSKVEDP